MTVFHSKQTIQTEDVRGKSNLLRTFRPKKEDMAEGHPVLHNEKFHMDNSSASLRDMKGRRVRCRRYAGNVGEIRNGH